MQKSSPTGLGWQEGLAGAPRDGEDFDWLREGTPLPCQASLATLRVSSLHCMNEARVTLPSFTVCLSGPGCPAAQTGLWTGPVCKPLPRLGGQIIFNVSSSSEVRNTVSSQLIGLAASPASGLTGMPHMPGK